MKIAVIGGTGTVGTGIVNLLKKEYEVISTGKTRGDFNVDLLDPKSIQRFFNEVKDLDGIISTIGDGKMGTLQEMKSDDFNHAFQSKIVANVNLFQEVTKHLKDGSFMIVTSGIAATNPIPGASTLSAACAAIEAWVRSASVEETNGIRINAVSPAFVKETMELFGMDSSTGISAHDTARVYQYLIDNKADGVVAYVPEYLPMLNEKV